MIAAGAASTPSLAASAVILDGAGRGLLVKQSYGGRRWALPGGMLDPGESPAEAAVREAREEIGVEVALVDLIAVYYIRSDEPGIRFAFRATVTSGEPAIRDTGELTDLGWFAPDEVPQPQTPTAAVAIRDALAGVRGGFRELADP